MKLILTTFSILIATLGYSQQKNYLINKNSVETVKAYGERISLVEDTKNNVPKSLARGTPLPAIGTLISDHGLTFLKNQLKKSEKKYTAEYAGRIVTKDPSLLGDITLKRQIKINPDTLVNASEFKFKVAPHGGGFCFEVDVVQIEYTKAKIKNKYYFLDLAFEIEITYLGKENKKTVVKSKPVYYAMFDPKDGSDPINNLKTDIFPLGKVTEVSIKITETNPYKVKMERIQRFLEDNDDLLSELIGKLKSE